MPTPGLRKEGMKLQKNKFFQMASAVWEAVAELLYPPRCPLCDELLLPGSNTRKRTVLSKTLRQGELPTLRKGICTLCERKLTRIAEPVCKKCGKPLSDERREYCGDCAGKKHSYRQGKAVFLYKGAMRQSMYRFKYSNRREYASFYADEAAVSYADWVRRREIEAIVPIPMYPAKKRRRGYNQAEVFAGALGQKLQIPVETKLVKRTRDTTPQKELSDSQRKKNLKNAFRVTGDKVVYRQILLVDDIYTTGSTMDAVAEALLAAGAQNIYYICICIGQGN